MRCRWKEGQRAILAAAVRLRRRNLSAGKQARVQLDVMATSFALSFSLFEAQLPTP